MSSIAEAQRDRAVEALRRIQSHSTFLPSRTARIALADIAALGESAPTQAPPVSATERTNSIIDPHVDKLGAWTDETFKDLIAALRTEFAHAIDEAERQARAAALEEIKQVIRTVTATPP